MLPRTRWIVRSPESSPDSGSSAVARTIIVPRTAFCARDADEIIAILKHLRAQPQAFRQSVDLKVVEAAQARPPHHPHAEVAEYLRAVHKEFFWWFYYLAPMPDDVQRSPLTLLVRSFIAGQPTPATNALANFYGQQLAIMEQEWDRVGDPDDVRAIMKTRVLLWFERISLSL